MKWLFLIARVRFRLLIKRRYKIEATGRIIDLFQKTSASIPIRRGCEHFVKCVAKVQNFYRNHALQLELYVKRAADLFERLEKEYLSELSSHASSSGRGLGIANVSIRIWRYDAGNKGRSLGGGKREGSSSSMSRFHREELWLWKYIVRIKPRFDF